MLERHWLLCVHVLKALRKASCKRDVFICKVSKHLLWVLLLILIFYSKPQEQKDAVPRFWIRVFWQLSDVTLGRKWHTAYDIESELLLAGGISRDKRKVSCMHQLSESKIDPRKAVTLPLLPQAQRLFWAECSRNETNVTFHALTIQDPLGILAMWWHVVKVLSP